MKHFLITAACRFYEIGIKHRLCVFGFIVALWCLAFFTFSHIKLNNSSVALLPDSSVQLQRMARGMDLAPFSRLLYVDFYHPKGDLDSLLEAVDTLKAAIPPELATPINQNLDIAPEELMELIPVFFNKEAETYASARIQVPVIAESMQNAVLTLSTFANNALIPWLRADPLDLKEIVTKNLPLSLNMPTSDMASDYGLSADKKHVLLVLQPMFSMHDTDAATKILGHIREAKAEFPADIKINLNGGVMHTAANSETITNDIESIVFLSFLGLAFIYLYFVRSWAGIWLLLTPCLAIGYSLGIMTGVNASLSGLALGFGAAILGIAEDYAIHVHYALQKEKNTSRIIHLLAIPLFQGFLLNASGFSVLLFSSIPAIRQLAAFALLSLFFGFIIALFVLPLCPRFYKKNLSKVVSSEPEIIPDTICAQEPVLWKCLLVTLVLSISCMFVFSYSRVDVSPRSMGVELNNDEMNTENFLQVWGQTSGDLLIIEHADVDVLFENTRKIANVINFTGEGKRNTVSTLAFFLPSQEEQKENIARWNAFNQTNGLNIKTKIIEECQLLGIDTVVFEPFLNMLAAKPRILSLELLRQGGFSNLVNFFVASTVNQENLIFQTLLISSEKVDYALLEKALRDEPALVEQLSIISPENLESEIRSVLHTETKYIPLTLILCVFLLYLCFFNFSKVFLALIPALCSMLCILIGMYFLNSPITLGTIAAFPLVLGLALDHGILISYDLEHGVNLGIRRALIVSSLTTAMSMGLLAFADHPTLRAMGQVIFLGLLVEIPASLYVLPLMCKKKTK